MLLEKIAITLGVHRSYIIVHTYTFGRHFDMKQSFFFENRPFMYIVFGIIGYLTGIWVLFNGLSTETLTLQLDGYGHLAIVPPDPLGRNYPADSSQGDAIFVEVPKLESCVP